MTTRLSGTLRLLTALALVLAVGWAGFVHRSPWIVAPLSLAFTVLYIAGKWRAWRMMVVSRGWGSVPKALIATWPIQVVVAGVFYLIGFGIGAIAADRTMVDGLQPFDWWFAAILVLASIPLTAFIEWLESRDGAGALGEIGAGTSEFEALIARHGADGDATGGMVVPQENDGATSGGAGGLDQLDIDPTPLTPQTFYSRHVPADKRRPPASEQQIAETERRLGVTLPPLLKDLYRIQDGGYIDSVLAPVRPDPRPTFDDWRDCFAHDYDELAPLERLTTLHERYLGWIDDTDPDEAAHIPEDAKQRIVLAMRYEDTTFLDYSRPGDAEAGTPRVGVVDFETHARDPDLWFEDFETFFAALRHTVDEEEMDEDPAAGP